MFLWLTSDYWSFCFSSSPNSTDLSFFNPLFSLPQKIIHLGDNYKRFIIGEPVFIPNKGQKNKIELNRPYF